MAAEAPDSSAAGSPTGAGGGTRTPLLVVARACLELAGSEADDRPDEALDTLKKVETDPAASVEALIDAAGVVARWFEDNEQYEDLLPFQRKLVAVVEARDSVNSTGYATTLHALADCLGKLKLYAEAEDAMSKALTIRTEIFGSHHTKTAFTLNSLAGLYTEQGQFDKATPLTQRSLEIFSGEMVANIRVKCLDDGRQVSLKEAERRLPKATNPIELHTTTEILDTCEVKNLDTGRRSTLASLDSVAPKAEDPMALRDVEDALATMVIKNVDTGEVMTMDRASGNIVPTTFAPQTRRSSMPNVQVDQSVTTVQKSRRGSLKGKFKNVFGSGRRKSKKKQKAAEQAQADEWQRSASVSSGRRPLSPQEQLASDPKAVTSLPPRPRPPQPAATPAQPAGPQAPAIQTRPINAAFVPSYEYMGDNDGYEPEVFDGD